MANRLLPVPSAIVDGEARRKRRKLAIYLLTFAGVVFRSEIAILLATHIAYFVIRGRISVSQEVIPAGLAGAFVGLLVTVPIDSFFWQKFPLWPEFAGFYYNAIEGNSTAWGTSPWYFYFTSAFPRIVMNPLCWQLCIPLALGMRATRQPSLDIILPLIAFIAVYSLQPHKEWRFIIYAVPGATAVSAIGANWIWTRRAKSLMYQFLSLCLIGSILASFMASAGLLAISRLNYPGATAVNRLHELANGSKKRINVHMDTLSCTSGVTRFLEMPVPASLGESGSTLWRYDKTEDPDLLLTPAFWSHFDYALAEKPEKIIGKWELVEVIDGFAGIGVKQMETDDKGQQDLQSDRPTIQKVLDDMYLCIPRPIRTKLLGGRWVQIKMEPAIRIMKRLPYSLPIAATRLS
ncbi:MAG: dolichyl-P-Man:Man(7)GlcNAc(2)-PP-dolichol alpha-1,6-mannosyltransferase [Sclerophora amabilis]|nr:MAG: dolichyl-P-Man:Man(7)GlcNAc(2)-PP-dolichol alpha-1,6-mannosyltransferase [Sclerophora amabilis]